jgi:PPM family protein phosphatase
MSIALRYTVQSDVGLLREGNEDSAYAGPHLLAIADGMGGHAAGEVASAVAIATLAPLDNDPAGTDMLQALADAIADANAELRQITETDPATEGMGTTLTALLWSGDEVAMCHIGDSRAYLLRDGVFHQISHDHTLVQSLVDEGRLTPEAAASHPQRSLVMRALQSSAPAEPDLAMLKAKVGDRFLLCSDGLSDVVSDDTVHKTLTQLTDLNEAVSQLINLAIRSGGPDNITCVLADVIDTEAGESPSTDVIVMGALTGGADQPVQPVRSDSPAARAHLLATGRSADGAGGAEAPGGAAAAGAAAAAGSATARSATTPAEGMPIPVNGLSSVHRYDDHGVTTWTAIPGTGTIAAPGTQPYAAQLADVIPPRDASADEDDEDDDPLIRSGHKRWPVVSVTLLVLLAVVGAGGLYGWRVTQDQYYVGAAGGKVVVFRGVNQAVAGFKLSTMVRRTDIPIGAVPSGEAGQIQATIPAATLTAAYRIVSRIKQDYKCAVAEADIRRWFADRARTTAKSKSTNNKTTNKHRSAGKHTGKAPRFGKTTARRMSGKATPKPSASPTARPAAKPATSATPRPTPSGTHQPGGTAPKNPSKQKTVTSSPKPTLPPFCPAGGAG